MVIELLCTTVVPLIWHRRVRHPASTRPSQVAVIVADVVVGVAGAVGIIRVIVLVIAVVVLELELVVEARVLVVGRRAGAK